MSTIRNRNECISISTTKKKRKHKVIHPQLKHLSQILPFLEG